MKAGNVSYLIGICGLLVLLTSGCVLQDLGKGKIPQVKNLVNDVDIRTAEIEMTLEVVDVETSGIKALKTAKAKKRLAALTGINVVGNITLDQEIGGSPFGDVAKDAIKQLVDQIDGTSSGAGWTLSEETGVIVESFENKSPLRASGDIGRGTAQLLVAELVNRGKWTVLTRDTMKSSLREQGLSVSEFNDPNTSVELKLKVAQYIIKGAITNAWVHEGL